MTDSVSLAHTAVLLGAGASFDAGLPLTHELATKLLMTLEADLHHRHVLVRAANFVYGAMVGHRSRNGGNPLEAVNVETMISAIRLLRYRDWHEVAPFVASWNDMREQFTAPPYSQHGSILVNEIALISREEHPSGQGLENLIRRIAQEVVEAPSDTTLFGDLESAITTRVRRILFRHGPLGYLDPLLDAAARQAGGMDVATLNYDLTVEHAAESKGIVLDRGPDNPRLGIPLAFASDAAIRLYKVHGSIDLREKYTAPEDTRRVEIVRDLSAEDFKPKIVLGDRDKLGSGGATVALLVAFSQALEKADRLVVVGYSFRDEHVNSVIFDWLDADRTRTLTVLDPSWPFSDVGWDPRLDLMRKLADEEPSRIAVIREGAGAGLSRAMSELPAASPDPRLDLIVSWSDDTVRVTIQNPGVILRNIRLTTNLQAAPTEMRLDHPKAIEENERTWVLSELEHDETVELTLTYPPGTSPRAIGISALDDIRSIDDTWDLSDPPTRRDRLR